MEEVKAIKINLTKKEKEIELIEFNLATATDAKTKDICSRQLEKVEAERDEILLQLEERDKSILNLEHYIDFGLSLKDNILKLWQLGNLSQKKQIQNLIFPEGMVYNKENDDIEPISKNDFMFLFNLKSISYKDIKKDNTSKIDELSPWVQEAGLEPAQPIKAKGF